MKVVLFHFVINTINIAPYYRVNGFCFSWKKSGKNCKDELKRKGIWEKKTGASRGA